MFDDDRPYDDRREAGRHLARQLHKYAGRDDVIVLALPRGGVPVAYEVAKTGGTSGAVMNAANEVAVEAFTAGKIAFGEISRTVELTIRRHRVQSSPSLDDLLQADRWARSEAANLVNGGPTERKTA